MVTTSRRPLEEYLALQYPVHIIADQEGGYVVEFPDLPGCLTQVEALEEVGPAASEAFRLWIEATYEDDALEIPLPSYPENYSGKLNVRLPKSLHRNLAEAAQRDGISLNTHIVSLLSRGDVAARIGRLLAGPVWGDGHAGERPGQQNK